MHLKLFRYLIIFFLAILIYSANAVSSGFYVKYANNYLIDGVVFIDAKFNLKLNNEPLRALINGVPLSFIIEIQVTRTRRYLPWNKTITNLEQRYRLMFHSLTDQYYVINLNNEVSENYSDFNQALANISELKEFPLLDRKQLNSKERYQAHIRISLDLESLPSPLKLIAYLSPNWYLKSNWHSFPLSSH